MVKNVKLADWHKADIKAALEKRNITLIWLDALHGLPHKSCSTAFYKPHAKAEAAIAQAIEIPAHLIWPSRYKADGTRLCPQPHKNYTKTKNQVKNLKNQPSINCKR